MGRCRVYMKEKAICVVAEGLTVDAFRVATDPMFEVDVDASDAVLGERVLQALAAEPRDLPQSEFTGGGDRIPEFFGYRSWNALERGARLLYAVQEGDQVTAWPCRRVKLHFEQLQEQSGRAAAEAEAVGALVRKKAEECET